MGVTADSSGYAAADQGLFLAKEQESDRVIALAGNPNVGKSTVFNALTGLHQHTGNWPGKTVTSAQGRCHRQQRDWILVDLPGTYSLMAHSTEEEVARDFICFGANGICADAVVVVCDATCLERNLNLVLQTLEITKKIVVCVNLMDEAKHKGIEIDCALLSQKLGVPVVAASARSGQGLQELMQQAEALQAASLPEKPPDTQYHWAIEQAIALLEPALEKAASPWPQEKLSSRWVALRLLEEDKTLCNAIKLFLQKDLMEDLSVKAAAQKAQRILQDAGLREEALRDKTVTALVKRAEGLCAACVFAKDSSFHSFDRRLDKILTSKRTGIPIMLLLLCVIFWLTITGANYPSKLLAEGLFWVQDRLSELFRFFSAPEWLHGMLVLGVFRTVSWVVSVMLPPMAIFFPLFTLLEDFGYLPRVAFNLDHQFKKANACGKQALTMCMGFGCNAAGVIGCRIIDSPRERLIAIVTNQFVPCNGRFPILIAVISMFFVGSGAVAVQRLVSTFLLTAVILLGVLMTFLVSKWLSQSILKGLPSSFTLELPPYRRPQIGKVILRSLLDRTLFVLGRAVVVAAPAGLMIWLMANLQFGGLSILRHCADFLNPLGHLLGMDGVIVLAFILGFPANEIVIPIIIMSYLSSTTMLEINELCSLKALFVENGWTWITAVSTMLFCLMHWPCSTTCLTIHKETQSFQWTALSFAIPTVMGMLVCFLFTFVARLL